MSSVTEFISISEELSDSVTVNNFFKLSDACSKAYFSISAKCFDKQKIYITSLLNDDDFFPEKIAVIGVGQNNGFEPEIDNGKGCF